MANQKGFILHGKATQAGSIVAALVDPDEDVTEFNLRKLTECSDAYHPKANRLPR